MRGRELTKIESADPALNRLQDHYRSVLNPALKTLADLSRGTDADTNERTLHRLTTDATAAQLTTDGTAPTAANQVALANNSALVVRADVLAYNPATGDSRAWTLQALVKRGANAAATSLVGAVATLFGANDAGAAGWTATVVASTARGTAEIQVSGAARWFATVHTTESA